MDMNVYAGAVAGKVFIGTDEALVALTAEGAEKLAGELPRLAQVARSLAVGVADEPFLPAQPVDLDNMAGRLVASGHRWIASLGWIAGNELLAGRELSYPVATRQAYSLAFGGG